MNLLGALNPILGTTRSPGRSITAALLGAFVVCSSSVQRTTYNLVAYSGKVRSPTAPHEHVRMLLNASHTPSGDESGDLLTVGELHSRAMPVGRVRLLRIDHHDTSNGTALLRVMSQSYRVTPARLRLATLTNQLVSRWNNFLLSDLSEVLVIGKNFSL